jgi:YXWGXW repeat-containing protein
MTRPLSKLIPFALLGGLIVTLTAGIVPAQQSSLPQLPPLGARLAVEPVAQAQPDMPEGMEVMARGPVHEAYASTAETVTATPIVEKQPPEPIEELPPDQKPAGENVQWIPGYWHWDDENTQYMWISGFWRVTPPGRVWVPGSWREARGGWQWAPGFWQEPDEQGMPDIQYLQEPPASVEIGPTIVQPTATSFYIPGSWVWRGRYVWRPGVWVEYRPGWVWVPSHWHWTPLGWVFCEGHWDYTLESRGVMFAPVVYTQPIYTNPGYVYTPMYVVSEPSLFSALFVRPGWGSYFFGDYFARNYVTAGFRPWSGFAGPTGYTPFSASRTWGYDPLWSYYRAAYRNDRDWFTGYNNMYDGRYRGTVALPPRTLTQQNTVINKITNVNVKNVTNNVKVTNRVVKVNDKDITAVTMVAPVKVVKDLQPEAKVGQITEQVRKQDAQHAKQTRQVGVERNKIETAAVGKGGAPPKLTEPKSLKLTVPKEIVTRAQVKDEKRTPPPRPNLGKVEPKELPKKDKIDPKEPPKKDKIDPKEPPKKEPPVVIPPPVVKKEPPVVTPSPKGKGEPPPGPKGKGDPKKDKEDPKKKDKDDPNKKDKTEPPPPPEAAPLPSNRRN